MAKIFDLINETHESPNRNNFDLTHKRHFTGKAGIIYPFLCQPVWPTDVWDIDSAIGVNLMPMWYPTQSNMRFIVHYFYVPYRIMDKEWKNRLQGLSDEEMPYLNHPASFYKTGSLADHLGLPTNLVNSKQKMYSYSLIPSGLSAPKSYFLKEGVDFDEISVGFRFDSSFEESSSSYDSSCVGNLVLEPLLPFSINYKYDTSQYLPFAHPSMLSLTLNFDEGTSFDTYLMVYGSDYNYDTVTPDKLNFIGKISLGDLHFERDSEVFHTFDGTQLNGLIGSAKYTYAFIVRRYSSSLTLGSNFYFKSFKMGIEKGQIIEFSEHPSHCPYYCQSERRQTNVDKLRSYAFRGYEMIYNAFYRNSQGNQPFVVDGVTQYNKYVTSDEGGSDTTNYELKSRNWELDAYTSCLPSPQQGDPVRVAMSASGRMTLQNEDGTTSTVRFDDLPDGQKGMIVRDADINDEEHARTIMSIASSGLSIEDFREGNALQRFLEQSLRSGFRYADFIFGHFGKAPSHQELDMPIFLGGYTQRCDINKVTNVAQTADNPLGQFAGSGQAFGAGRHRVKRYFDDFGLVFGLVTLVPDAAYSQVVPKHFLYQNRLDFYFPEFAQLGMQPITYEEFCPGQSYADYVDEDNSKLLTDTFGYQRPNHDLVWLPDSLHGLFRTSLNASVVNRRFGSRPELGNDFLVIKPEEVNDIFSVTNEDDDIFIGQIVTKISAKRPLPRVVVPSLGR